MQGIKSLSIDTIHTAPPPLPGHFSTIKSKEQMFKTADEDVLSAKKYLWLRGIFNFLHLTPWRHNNNEVAVQYTGANIAGKNHFGHRHDAKQIINGS